MKYCPSERPLLSRLTLLEILGAVLSGGYHIEMEQSARAAAPVADGQLDELQEFGRLSSIHLISGLRTDEVIAGSHIITILRDAGLPVQHHSWREPHAVSSGLMNGLSSSAALLIVLDQPSCPWLLDQVTAMAGETSTAVLRVAVTGSTVEVGPQFRGRYTACLRCLRRSVDEAAQADQVEKRQYAEGSREIATALGLTRCSTRSFLDRPVTGPALAEVARMGVTACGELASGWRRHGA